MSLPDWRFENGKNYMPEIAQMLGVEIGEEFDLILKDGVPSEYNPYKFTNETMVDCDGEDMLSWLYNILTGIYTIQKRPWRPKDCGEYWTVFVSGEVGCGYFDYNSARDLALLNMGNCFPTKEAAEAAKTEMLAKFEEIKKGVRE
ncbi:MAG: hypothetical protein EUB_03909 [Eubacterium sp.]